MLLQNPDFPRVNVLIQWDNSATMLTIRKYHISDVVWQGFGHSTIHVVPDVVQLCISRVLSTE